MIGYLRRLYRRRQPRRAGSLRRPLLAAESLEKRELLALLGVAAELGYPVTTYDEGGRLSYDAAWQLFSLDAEPFQFRESAFPPILDVSGESRQLKIQIAVDHLGALIGGVPGHDLRLVGDVDTNGDLVADFSGILLTGEITAFGLLHGANSSRYDFRFTPTGGQISSYFRGREIGVTTTSENSTANGGFETSFEGDAQGNIGPIAPTCGPHASGEDRPATIADLYRQYLGREPDQAGICYWSGVWNAKGLEWVQAGIIGSAEYHSAAGGTNAAWVKALYGSLLGREASTDEVHYWVQRLAAVSRGDVVLGFVTSPEYRSAAVAPSACPSPAAVDASNLQYWPSVDRPSWSLADTIAADNWINVYADRVAMPDGTLLDTAGTKTAGIQEAIDYAVSHGYNVSVDGGSFVVDDIPLRRDLGPVERGYYRLEETLVFPPIQSFTFLAPEANFDFFIADPDKPAVLFDSTMMAHVQIKQVIYRGQDAAVKFQPRHPNPYDTWVTAVTDSYFHIQAIAVLNNGPTSKAVEWTGSATPGQGGITHNTFYFPEVLGGAYGMYVNTLSEPVAGFFGNTLQARHIHAQTLVPLYVGQGKSDQVFNNFWRVQISPGPGAQHAALVHGHGDLYHLAVHDGEGVARNGLTLERDGGCGNTFIIASVRAALPINDASGGCNLVVFPGLAESTRRRLVGEFYGAWMGRAAGAAELEYWSGNWASTSQQHIMSQILASAEYFQRHGGTNTAFVSALYRDLLQRAPDASGLAWWLHQLNTGAASRSGVALAILGLPEYHSSNALRQAGVPSSGLSTGL